MTTQAEMLASQWTEEPTMFGFTDSDWFKDVKEVAGLWGFVNSGGQLEAVGQQQSDLMYSIERPMQPNAQYMNPKEMAQQQTGNIGGVNIAYVIGAVGVAALLAMALKK